MGLSLTQDNQPALAERAEQSPPSGLDRSDLVVSAVLIVMCAFLYWDTTRWPAVPASLAQNAPPTVFPRLLIGSIVVMALALPFERVIKRRSGAELDIGGEDRPKPVVFLTAALMTLAVYFMPVLGIFPVMVAATALLPLLWGERRYGLIAAFAIGLPIAVAVLFALGLKVNLAFGLTGALFR